MPSIAFAILALGFGLTAAYYWYESAKIQVDPDWKNGIRQTC